MIDLSRVEKYYVACGYTDMRRGIDGLAAIVSQQFGAPLCEDSLFLFCGRRTDRIKALYFSGDGYVLLYKRLNNGAFQWPRSEQELRLLDRGSPRRSPGRTPHRRSSPGCWSRGQRPPHAPALRSGQTASSSP